jgi:uncharacterized membrane protein HdeD (DUF308 family)
LPAELRRVGEGESLLAGAGVTSIVFGFVMVIWPRGAMIALTWLIGLYAAGFGMILLVVAARLYGLRHQRFDESSRTRSRVIL